MKSHRLTGIFDKKSAIGTSVQIFGFWGLGSYDPISTIFRREAAYAKGALYAKIYSDIIIGTLFI